MDNNKKLSYRRETARRYVSVEMLSYCCTNNANRSREKHFQQLPRFIPLSA